MQSGDATLDKGPHLAAGKLHANGKLVLGAVGRLFERCLELGRQPLRRTAT